MLRVSAKTGLVAEIEETYTVTISSTQDYSKVIRKIFKTEDEADAFSKMFIDEAARIEFPKCSVSAKITGIKT